MHKRDMHKRDVKQPKQSPSTGESTKDQDKQVPARSAQADPSGAGGTEPPPTPRDAVRDATSVAPREKGPKSGGMGPKQ
jgi:hypothetical protein